MGAASDRSGVGPRARHEGRNEQRVLGMRRRQQRRPGALRQISRCEKTRAQIPNRPGVPASLRVRVPGSRIAPVAKGTPKPGADKGGSEQGHGPTPGAVTLVAAVPDLKRQPTQNCDFHNHRQLGNTRRRQAAKEEEAGSQSHSRGGSSAEQDQNPAHAVQGVVVQTVNSAHRARARAITALSFGTILHYQIAFDAQPCGPRAKSAQQRKKVFGEGRSTESVRRIRKVTL